MTGWYHTFRPKPKAKSGTPNLSIKGIPSRNILPEEVVKAIFLKWEVEARLHPERFLDRDKLLMQSVDEVSGANTKLFLQYAEDMGLLHD